MALGFDVGTYNLVCSKRNEKKEIEVKREINAFLEIPLGDDFLFNMMKTSGVPLIKKEKTAYALGEAATKMAYTMNTLELKRPMCDGCVNPREKESFEILSNMIHGLIDNMGPTKDGEKLYYCVPANAINEQTDADYHSKILHSIFKAYKSENNMSVDPHPINEALAIIYAELGANMNTGIACSAGAGMINICFAIFGAPVFQFSIVNSGDWIDKMAAKATGESPAFINREKTKVDLLSPPRNMVERAIQTQYRIMIEKTVLQIKAGLERHQDKKARLDQPLEFIVAGGTSLATGFDHLFKEIITEAKLPINLGEVRRPKDALYSVAKGCLIAAENA